MPNDFDCYMDIGAKRVAELLLDAVYTTCEIDRVDELPAKFAEILRRKYGEMERNLTRIADMASECVCNCESKLLMAQKELEDQIHLWQTLPGGIEENAKENDTSPDDAIAWLGGVAVKQLRKALKEIGDE